MAKARKEFIKGMNRDVTSDKRPPGTYYDLHNFRLVTEEGLTTGSLVNEASTSQKFSIPNTEELTLTDGTVIPAQAGLKIIGWTTIIDVIVLFTTNEDSSDPSSYGQIWKLTFNEVTGEVNDIDDDGYLTEDAHLVYNQILDFSSHYRIGRAVGRYENAETQKVYWTDNYNSIRVFNIAVDDSLNVSLDNIDIDANTDFSQPIITDIGSGNLPTQAMIQFSYKLLTTSGAESTFSPPSALVPLTETLQDGISWEEFSGDGSPTTLSRSVTYTIKGIDTDWNVIQHYAIVYNELDIFTIYLFDEESVPATGETTVVCTSIADATVLDSQLFNEISSGFTTAKDIAIYQNRLVAANTKTTRFQVEGFDARVYRYNASGDALITDVDQGDITLDADDPDYSSVPDDHDAINPYNNENQDDWDNDLQYKYTSNPLILGGEGPNISYTFVTEQFQGNTIDQEDVDVSPPHLEVDTYSESATVITLGVSDSDGDDITYNQEDQISNMAGTTATSIHKGYARGETYRFGIVFYSEKGSPSYVNWIGDIRMPEPDDGFPIGDDGNITVFPGNNKPYLHSLGIEFTVDISDVLDQISGYSIVRVQRDSADRTRLGTGLQGWFVAQDTNDSLLGYENADGDEYDAPFGTTNIVEVGAGLQSSYFLNMKPGWGDTQANYPGSRRVCYMQSPLGQTVAYTHKEEDFIKTYSYYEAPAVQYGQDTGAGSYMFYYKTNNSLLAKYAHDTQRFQIGEARRMRLGEWIYDNTDIIDGYTGGNGLMNASSCRDSTNAANIPMGVGNLKVAIMLLPFGETTLTGMSNPETQGQYAGGSYYQTPGDFQGGTTSPNKLWFREIAMCRYVLNQYGGNSYEDRSKNQYFSTGHFQIINDNVTDIYGGIKTFEVFGGDVFVNYLDDEYIEQYWNGDSVYGSVYQDSGSERTGIAVCFPTESIINQEYRVGRRWFKDRDALDPGEYQSNSYAINTVFSQEDNSQEKFWAEDFLDNSVDEHSHQIWASQPSIDGSLEDGWRNFQVNDIIEVTGIYGPINRLLVFNDKLYFYQNSGVGVTTINERSLLNDGSGTELAVGTGGVFPYFQYVSTTTGSSHQFSVINTQSHIYHWDARLKKIYRTAGGGMEPISDTKGMSSFFHNQSGPQLADDYTLRSYTEGGPVGVHAIADYRYNRVLFTFIGTLVTYQIDELYDEDISGFVFTADTIVVQRGVAYYVVSSFSYPADSVDDAPDLFDNSNVRLEVVTDNAFTISYNELLNSFESFYDYTPNLYLQYGRRLLSATPDALSSGWEHNTSDTFASFYNTTYDSILEIILGVPGGPTSSFDNISWQGTVTDDSGVDVESTFNTLRVYNEYQDTGTVDLNGISDRHLRLWRVQVPRDSSDSLSRIRAPWTHVLFTYDNEDNYRHTVKDIEYSFRPSRN